MNIIKPNPFREEVSRIEVPIDGALVDDLLDFDEDGVIHHEVSYDEEEQDEPDLFEIINQETSLWRIGGDL